MFDLLFYVQSFVDMRHMVHSSGRYFCNVDDFTNIYTCKRLKYDIVQLPTEILVLIFRKLHIRDLLSVGQVCISEIFLRAILAFFN